MPKELVIDEILVTVFVPVGLPDTAYRAIRRTLIGRRFRTRLERGVGDAIRRYPSLRQVRVSVTR
jgi:hypothetical protein